jgi:hypothetical protein
MNAAGMFSNAAVKLAYDKNAYQLSEEATSPQEGGGEPTDYTLCCNVLIVIAIILLILFIIAVLTEAYESGDGIGPSIVTVLDSTGEVLSDIAGGVGGSSGRSSGCASSSCACACACAGSGRAGCSRKAIGVSRLAEAADQVIKALEK